MVRATAVFGFARRLSVTGAVLVTIGGSVALTAPVAANAATGLPRACTVKAAKTSNLAVGTHGVHPTGGTTFTKGGGPCLDLNVTKVSATDGYEGWLFNKHTATWSRCSKGFVTIRKGNTSDKVLCSGVRSGTLMAVVQKSKTQRHITVKF